MRQFLIVLGLAGALAAGPATAQDAGGLMAADEEMVQQLLKPRSIQELDSELASAKRRAEAADKEVEDAAQVLSVARARVEVKKGEISLLKTRSKLARKEGAADRRAEVEKLLSREESGLRVFKAMAGAAEAQRDRAEAAAEFSRSRMKMQEAELDLARQHEARVEQSAAATDAASLAKLGAMDLKIRQSARRVLSSLREYAKKSKRLAESTGDLANARLDLLDAWEHYKGL